MPNEHWVKSKCCNGYYHNKCFYDNIEYKNKNIYTYLKTYTIFNKDYEFIVNNINDSCILCRKKLKTCDIFKQMTRNNIINTEYIDQVSSSNFSFTIPQYGDFFRDMVIHSEDNSGMRNISTLEDIERSHVLFINSRYN